MWYLFSILNWFSIFTLIFFTYEIVVVMDKYVIRTMRLMCVVWIVMGETSAIFILSSEIWRLNRYFKCFLTYTIMYLNLVSVASNWNVDYFVLRLHTDWTHAIDNWPCLLHDTYRLYVLCRICHNKRTINFTGNALVILWVFVRRCIFVMNSDYTSLAYPITYYFLPVSLMYKYLDVLKIRDDIHMICNTLIKTVPYRKYFFNNIKNLLLYFNGTLSL